MTEIQLTSKNLYYLQKPEINVIATIKSGDLVNFCRSLYDTSIKFKETVYCLYFVGKDCIGVTLSGSGCADASYIDLHSIIRTAILLDAESIVICHNHPNGVLLFSKSDRQASKLIAKELKKINVKLQADVLLSGTSLHGIVHNY